MQDNNFVSWDFNAFELKPDDDIEALISMFKYLGFVTEFNVDEKILRAFCESARAKYHDNLFHSWNHAVDVTQYIFAMLTKGGALEILTRFEGFLLLVSGITHDLDHPGFNNGFLNACNDKLDARYHGLTLLEIRHNMLAQQLIRDPNTNIFCNLPSEKFELASKIIEECIMATNMGEHFAICKSFSELSPSFDVKNTQHHIELLKMLIKCGDLSNCSRPTFAVAAEWAKYIQAEFFEQGDKEKEYNVPVSKGYDRDLDTCKSLPNMQIFFISTFILPLFRETAKVVPKLSESCDCLETTVARWKKKLEEMSD